MAWTLNKYGFYSVTCARKSKGAKEIDLDTLMIRGRVRAHLESIQKRFPDLLPGKIVVSEDTDYKFRLFAKKVNWAKACEALALETDYSNFKGKVAEFQGRNEYERALHDIWHVLYRLQSGKGNQREDALF